MTPEDRLCLLLARRSVSEEMRRQALELLASPLRWSVVLERAYAHQIYPLIYHNLRALDLAGVPDEVRAELAGAFRRNAVYSLALAGELVQVLRPLNAAAIPVIALKGYTLAQSLYGDVALRVCADVDLLLPPTQVARAVDLLVAGGHRDALDDRFFSRLALRHGRHYSLMREVEGNSYLVELHWSLLQGSSVERPAMDDVWRESRGTTILGEPAQVLSPEWEFLYLCIHAADHGWQALRLLVDIHELCLAKQLDWELVGKKAKQFELGRVVSQTLSICLALLDTPMPFSIGREPLPSRPPLFPATPYYHGASQAAFFHLQALARRGDKLRFAATVVLIPKPSDREFLRLPAALSFLYYAARPLRLLVKWGWAAIRKCMGWLLPSHRAGAQPDRNTVPP